jgi:hypothetical protein
MIIIYLNIVSKWYSQQTNYWEVTVRLVDNNYDTVLDITACQPGDKTHWISAHMPELHEEGNLHLESLLPLIIISVKLKKYL